MLKRVVHIITIGLLRVNSVVACQQKICICSCINEQQGYSCLVSHKGFSLAETQVSTLFILAKLSRNIV
jgi:hypothetical protein